MMIVNNFGNLSQGNLVKILPELLNSNSNGIDTSSHQGEYDVEKACSLADFIIHRSSVSGWKDRMVGRNWLLGKGKTIQGLYHALYPSHLVPADSQKKLISEAIAKYPCELPFSLDVEVPGCGIDLVLALGARVLNDTGKYPMIYTSPGFWNPMFANASVSQKAAGKKFFKNCPLWVAHYTNLSDPMNVEPWGDLWDFWQYKIGGPEIALQYGLKYYEAKGIDLDVYNGSFEELKIQFGIGTSPAPIGKEIAARILSMYYWFRSSPEYIESSKDVLLPQGYIAELTGNEKKDPVEKDMTWIEVKLNHCNCSGWISKNLNYIEIIKE